MTARRRSRLCAAAAALATGVAAAALAAEPIAWAGAAVALGAALWLASELRGTALPERALHLGPVVLICCVAVWVLSDVLVGGLPLAHDHPVHYYKTWVLVHDLLPSGRLWGWSDRWYAGMPVNEGYPFLPYLWSAGAHLLTFGLVPLETSYGLGQVALWALLAAGACRWGQRLGGPAAGLLAGLFLLLDPGAFRGGGREGGWTYFAQFGVWPQALALAFALHAGLAAAAALESERPRRLVALAAVLGGLALLAHPLGLVPLAGLAAALLSGQILAPSGEARPLRAVRRTLAWGGLAVLLAAFWYGPFVVNRACFSAAPGAWRDLDDLAASLLRGELFLDSWAIPSVLALAGAVALARRRQAEDVALLGLAGALTTFASPHFLGALFGSHLPGPLAALQLDRVGLAAKPFFFVLAGVGGAALLRAKASPEGRAEPGPRPARRLAAAAALCLLAAPLALWAARRVPGLLPEVGQLPTAGSSEDREAMGALAGWLRARARTARGAPVRVALRHESSRARVVEELFLVAARAGVAVHHLASTPADTFRYQSWSGAAEDLRDLNVRWLVSRGPAGGEGLEEGPVFGPFHVYSVEAYSPRRITVEGAGRARLATFGPELVRLRLDGVDETTRIVVHRSPHPRWEARLDGVVLPIRERHRGRGATFVEVLPERDGLLELRYGRRPADDAGLGLSLLGLLLLGLLLAPERAIEALRHRIAALGGSRPSGRARAVGVAVATAAAVAALVAALWPGDTAARGRDLVAELGRARLTAELRPPCRTLGLCDVPPVPAVRVLRGHDGRLEPCIRLTAPTAGRLRLELPVGRAGPRIRGAWYWRPGPRADREVRPEPLATSAPRAALLVGTARHELQCGGAGRWSGFDLPGSPEPAPVALELESDSPGRVEACFVATVE